MTLKKIRLMGAVAGLILATSSCTANTVKPTVQAEKPNIIFILPMI